MIEEDGNSYTLSQRVAPMLRSRSQVGVGTRLVVQCEPVARHLRRGPSMRSTYIHGPLMQNSREYSLPVYE